MDGFKFFDGETGKNYQVTEWVDDGKFDFITDLEALDLIRWESDGGAYCAEDKKKYYDMYFDWKAFYKYKGQVQRKERKRKKQNYVMFGIKS